MTPAEATLATFDEREKSSGKRASPLESRLRYAGITWNSARYILLTSLATAFVFLGVAPLGFGSAMIIAIIFSYVAIVILPFELADYRRERAGADLSGFLRAIAKLLEDGSAFRDAISTACLRVPKGVLRGSLDAVIAKIALGKSIRDCTEELLVLIRGSEIRMVVTYIRLAESFPGSERKILIRAANYLQERNLHRKSVLLQLQASRRLYLLSCFIMTIIAGGVTAAFPGILGPNLSPSDVLLKELGVILLFITAMGIFRLSSPSMMEGTYDE